MAMINVGTSILGMAAPRGPDLDKMTPQAEDSSVLGV